jgi:4-hydroxy 2-oxovalerate aldolase
LDFVINNDILMKQQAIRQTRFFQDNYSVLDATLRDAGYLNDWAFSRDQIFDVVGAVAKTGVEATEVGYISDNPDLPLAARCEANLLQELREHTNNSINFAVMISLSETEPETLFASRRELLDLVRIPCTIAQVDAALRIAEAANRFGIAASLNLVNISTLLPEQFIDTARKVEQSGVVDVFYLADSRGACRPEDISAIAGIVRKHWTGLFGFHAHDNTGFASVNPLMALEAGCNVIDGTVNGLGLGSGNTKLQHAMNLVQQKQPNKPYRYEPLDQLSRFDVPMPAAKSYLYYLVGAKNLAQLWVEPLVERYGEKTAQYLQYIPRQPYTHIEQVIKEVEAYA